MHGVRADAPWCPRQHRVHPAHQRSRRRRAGARHRVRRAVPGARPRRRLSGRARRHSAGPTAPAGDHEVQPGADLDAGERRRHRRGVHVHLRHGRARRLPVRRPHHAGVEPLPPRRRASRSTPEPPGCCAISTGSASIRSAPRNCWTCGRTWPRAAATSTITDGEFSLPDYQDFLADNAEPIEAFRPAAGRGLRRRAAGVGSRRANSSARADRSAGRSWSVHLDVALCSRISASIAHPTEGEMAADKRKPTRHTEVERKFAVTEATVSPSFDGLVAVGRGRPLTDAAPGRRVLRHARARLWPRTRSRCAAAPAGRTRAGISSCLPGADARTEVRAAARRATTTRCPTSCETSCSRSSGTDRSRRWHASRPPESSTCSTGRPATRSPSSATTR